MPFDTLPEIMMNEENLSSTIYRRQKIKKECILRNIFQPREIIQNESFWLKIIFGSPTLGPEQISRFYRHDQPIFASQATLSQPQTESDKPVKMFFRCS
jgi:hypothetical protein